MTAPIEINVRVPDPEADAAEREMLWKLLASDAVRKAAGWTCTGSVVIDGRVREYRDVDEALALFEARLRVLGAV